MAAHHYVWLPKHEGSQMARTSQEFRVQFVSVEKTHHKQHMLPHSKLWTYGVSVYISDLKLRVLDQHLSDLLTSSAKCSLFFNPKQKGDQAFTILGCDNTRKQPPPQLTQCCFERLVKSLCVHVGFSKLLLCHRNKTVCVVFSYSLNLQSD